MTAISTAMTIIIAVALLTQECCFLRGTCFEAVLRVQRERKQKDFLPLIYRGGPSNLSDLKESVSLGDHLSISSEHFGSGFLALIHGKESILSSSYPDPEVGLNHSDC